MRDFLWGASSGRRKICWIAWKTMVKPKAMGGLGIRSLRATNKALMEKWRWRFTKPYGGR